MTATPPPPAPDPAEEALAALAAVDTATALAIAQAEATLRAAVEHARALAMTWAAVAAAMGKSQPWVVRKFGPRRARGELYPRRTEPVGPPPADLTAAVAAAGRAITDAAAALVLAHRVRREQIALAVARALSAGAAVAAVARTLRMTRGNLHRYLRGQVEWDVTTYRHTTVTVHTPEQPPGQTSAA